MSQIGERVRRARLARVPRMTLAELAGERLSISLVSKIERGLVQPSVATLSYLAERLGLAAGELVGERSSGDAALVALMLARARVALALDDPETALGLLVAPDSAEEWMLRAEALLRNGEDDAALDAVAAAHANDGVAGLVRGAVFERRGERARAQEAYAGALGTLPAGAAERRAEALLGLARGAEAAGAVATARNLYGQAQAELTAAASPSGRRRALGREADRLAARGDVVGAAAAMAAAAEMASLSRAAALRADVAAQTASLDSGASATRYREASEATAHRSVRHPRE